MKNKNLKKIRGLFLAIFIISAGFLFLQNTRSALAASCSCQDPSSTILGLYKSTTDQPSSEACKQICTQQGSNFYKYDGAWIGVATKNFDAISNEINGDSCSWTSHPINCMLLVILKLAGWLLNIAILLFAWVIDASKLTTILSNDAIFDSWKVVRDLLNMGFILVLLYIAFATIFQVTSYNYKNRLLWLVIMALLVNFSYPITRFIIDVSNSLMYTILDNSFGATTSADIVFQVAPQGFNDIKTIITTADGDTTRLIASTIFLFILALTILAIGILLLIRTIALAIIIIFSPVAFVGSILGKGKDWWDNLFKYAIAGPMMALVLAVSTKIMIATNQLSASGAGQDYTGAGTITDFVPMARFIVSITILWIGISMASKDIAGSKEIIGKAQKFAKWVPSAIWGSTGVPGGFKKATGYYGKKGAPGLLGKIPGLRGSEKTEATENYISGFLTKGREGAKNTADDYRNNLDKEAIEKESKRNDMPNMSTFEIRAKATNSKSKFEKAAALQELANRSQATGDDLNTVGKIFGENSPVFKQMQAKIKIYDPVAAFAHIKDSDARSKHLDNFIDSNQFDAKKISDNSLGNDLFMSLAFNANAIGSKDLAELNKKGEKYRNAIETSLGNLVSNGNFNDATKESHKNVHMAHFAQTGIIRNASFASNIASGLDKDNVGNMTLSALSQLDSYKNNIKQGRLKDIVQSIKDNNVARNLVLGLADKNTSTHAHYVKNDPILRNYLS